MPRSHRPPGTHLTILAITAAILLAACGSTKAETLPPDFHPGTTQAQATTTTTAVAATTTTTLTGDAAIIAADKAAMETFIAIAKQNPINVADPSLAQHAAGKQLVDQRAGLNLYFFHHHHLVGTYTGSQYRVVQHLGNSALVLSCDLDMTAVVDDASGQVVTPAPNKSSLANTRLDLINGQWMVTEAGVRSPTC